MEKGAKRRGAAAVGGVGGEREGGRRAVEKGRSLGLMEFDDFVSVVTLIKKIAAIELSRLFRVRV